MPSYMTIWWIAAGVIIIVMLLLGRRFKNSTLDKFPLLPDEKVLFEDEVKKVTAQTGPRPIMFPRCFVRVTSQRVIVAQHTLFGGNSSRLPIRYVIYFDKQPEPSNGYGGGALKTGYVSFVTTKANIKTSSEGEKQRVEIVPQSEPGWTTGVPYHVRIFTDRVTDYTKIF